jgi:hypothetical protein
MTNDDVRVLTVRQPWASAIADGTKPVENRTRPTSYRGPVLIHAGLAPADVTRETAPEVLLRWSATRPHRNAELPVGVVLAVANLAGVHADRGSCCGPWAERGAWHWRFDEVVALERPVAHRGALGLPRATPELLADVARALGIRSPSATFIRGDTPHA